MDNAIYTSLTRLSGLAREMQSLANNVANAGTHGYRKEGVVFSEYVQKVEDGPSLSMAAGRVRATSHLQGGLEATGGALDLAIEGEGYFLVETPDGQALTRAGAFTPNAMGELVTHEGLRVLDAGGAPILLPLDGGDLAVAKDGTVSSNGAPLAQIGLWQPAGPEDMERRAGLVFALKEAPVPAEGAAILQGHLEKSNVNPVTEIARLVEVQRAYELGQSFLEKEDGRIRGVLQTLGR